MTTAACNYTGLRAYSCECSNPRCREQVWLRWSDYRAASQNGHVVSRSCIPNHATVLRYLNAGTAAVVRP